MWILDVVGYFFSESASPPLKNVMYSFVLLSELKNLFTCVQKKKKKKEKKNVMYFKKYKYLVSV